MREPEPRDLAAPSERLAPGARRAATWRRYLRFWGPRAVADVDDELAFHFEMRVRDYAARGMSESEARDAVLRRLGGLSEARAECVAITSRRERRMARAEIVDAFVQDVRFAFRTLARQKGWAAVAIITLALGIGANTAVFSVVNQLLLHPLDYPGADRIAVIMLQPTNGGGPNGIRVSIGPSPEVIRSWRESSRAFEAIEGYQTRELGMLERDGGTSAVQSASVFPGFLDLAGAHPLIGRAFTPQDLADGGRVALLGEALWRQRFGAQTAAVGRSITLDGNPYTIIGVLPETVRLPKTGSPPTDIWLPLDPRDKTAYVTALGRLRPGQTIAAAERDLDSLTVRALEAEKSKSRFRAHLMVPRELVGSANILVMLSAAVALVLLIACANVAHLLIARAAARQRELAIRAAVGAGRARLFRQLLTESLVLTAAGCVAGIAIGWAALRLLVAARPAGAGELAGAHLDGAALLVALGLSVVTGVVFGMIGVVQSARYSTHETLKAGALSTSATRNHHRVRGLLVVSQMALSTTLLVGATLLVRSVIHLETMDPGFRPEGLYSVQMPRLQGGVDSAALAHSRALTAAAVARVRAIPGVQALTVTGSPPGSRSFLIGTLQVEGQPDPAPGATSFMSFNGVDVDYFRVMGIPVLQGTTFTDTAAKARQVIVNRGLAQKYWGNASPLGKRLRVVYDGQGDWYTVVGVVGDAATTGLTIAAADPLLYMAGGGYSPALMVRVGPGASPMPAVRRAVSSLSPSLPPPELSNVEELLAKTAAGPRFTMILLTIFTALAVLLAAVGLYGVLAYAVAQRSREIGIRIALGASSGRIARSIVLQGLGFAVAGVIAGLVGAFWGTKLIAQMLYGVERTDPVSFTIGATVLVATALLACIVPTRRAVGVDPLVAMRAE